MSIFVLLFVSIVNAWITIVNDNCVKVEERENNIYI